MDYFGKQIEPYPASEVHFYVSVQTEDSALADAVVFYMKEKNKCEYEVEDYIDSFSAEVNNCIFRHDTPTHRPKPQLSKW